VPWNGRLTEAHVSQIYKYRHIQVYINYFYPRTHHRIPLCYFNFFLSTECTQAGLLKLASLRALPFWWDDVCNFDTLESLVVQAFNQSQKQTARQEKASQPRSMPLMTMNPHCLYKKKRVSKEKISR